MMVGGSHFARASIGRRGSGVRCGPFRRQAAGCRAQRSGAILLAPGFPKGRSPLARFSALFPRWKRASRRSAKPSEGQGLLLPLRKLHPFPTSVFIILDEEATEINRKTNPPETLRLRGTRERKRGMDVLFPPQAACPLVMMTEMPRTSAKRQSTMPTMMLVRFCCRSSLSKRAS